MPNWSTITQADLKERFAAPEWSVVSSVLLVSGQVGSTVMDDLLTGTMDTVRGYVASCRRNQMAATGIPNVLKDTALDIATVTVYRRLGGKLVDVDGQREKARSEAISRLKDVAAGLFLVPVPDTALDTSNWNQGSGSYDYVDQIAIVP